MTRGSTSSPPLPTALTAPTICSGVTPTWYPIETDASALSVHFSGLQTMPGLSPGKSGDTMPESERCDIAAQTLGSDLEADLDRADVARLDDDVGHRQHVIVVALI